MAIERVHVNDLVEGDEVYLPPDPLWAGRLDPIHVESMPPRETDPTVISVFFNASDMPVVLFVERDQDGVIGHFYMVPNETVVDRVVA